MKRPVVIILLVAALLFILAGIGAVVFFSVNGGTQLFSGRMQASATAEESKTLKVDPARPVSLDVTDDAGQVTITGADVKTVQVKATRTAYAVSQSRADAEVKEIKYKITQKDNTVTITYDVPDVTTIPSDLHVFNTNQDTVDFVITVPAQTIVDVQSGMGAVDVSDISGEVKITNSFGDVNVEQIEGALAVDTNSGQVQASAIDAGDANIELVSGFGKLSLQKASGKDIKLDSSSGALEMSDVRASGAIDMSTDFGDIDFTSGSANQLKVGTNSGKVTLNTLALENALAVKSEFGEITVEQVKASSYDIETNSGSITADGVFGKVKAHSGFGSITVKNADSVTLDLDTQSGTVKFEGSLGQGPHFINTDFGDINLTLPGDSALDVDLKTDFGSITSGIPITVILSGEVEKNHQNGKINAGGDQLTVETQSGNISIQSSK